MSVISGMGFNEFTKVGHELDDYSAVVADASGAAQIEAEFLRLQANAREYAVTGHEEDAILVHEIATHLIGVVDEAYKSELDPTHRASLEEMKDDVTQYLGLFGKIEKLEHEFKNLIHDRMEPEGVKIYSDLREMLHESVKEGNTDARIFAEGAMEHALLARLYSNILIGRKDESFGAKAAGELGKLHQSLASIAKVAHTPKEKALVKELEELAIDYEKTIDKIHEDELEIRKIVDGEMKSLSKELVSDAEHLRKLAVEEEHVISEETMATIESAELQLILIALGGQSCHRYDSSYAESGGG